MNKELTGGYPEISVLSLQDVYEQRTHRWVQRNQCIPSTRCQCTRSSHVVTMNFLYSFNKMSMNKGFTDGYLGISILSLQDFNEKGTVHSHFKMSMNMDLTCSYPETRAPPPSDVLTHADRPKKNLSPGLAKTFKASFSFSLLLEIQLLEIQIQDFFQVL